MAKTKLENLTVKKVDFVDVGADQQANILITKRDISEVLQCHEFGHRRCPQSCGS